MNRSLDVILWASRSGPSGRNSSATAETGKIGSICTVRLDDSGGEYDLVQFGFSMSVGL